jgi:hypothetical protein
VRIFAFGPRETILVVDDSVLERLVEEPLQSVVFVMDYLQLDFGDARFTAYVWPTVTISEATLRFGDPGYRDALCAFITHTVIAADESPDVGLVIRFDLGAIVTNPEPTDFSGPEIAQLHVFDPMELTTSLMVWRPGEDAFAGREWT